MEEKDIRRIDVPKLTWKERLYLPAIWEGLKVTIGHLFGKKFTTQYPEQVHELVQPATYRGVHRLNRDDQGRVKCVACFMCPTICPAHCIDVVAEASPWPDREKYAKSFIIDELRCIYCGMCEEACPVDAIELTSYFDLSGASRQEMIFDKEKLLSVYDQTKDAEPMKTAGRVRTMGPTQCHTS